MTKLTISIVHYPNTISDDFTSDLLTEYQGSSLDFNQVVIDTSKPQASWHEMILHAYIVLDPEFWTAYLSGTLSAVTMQILISAINKISQAVQDKKIKCLQSDGIKETKINCGFKAHPKKGYSIDLHVEGNVTTEILGQAFKHVEKIRSKQESHLREVYEVKGKPLKKKR